MHLLEPLHSGETVLLIAFPRSVLNTAKRLGRIFPNELLADFRFTLSIEKVQDFLRHTAAQPSRN
jgi:hypothetical protein